MTPASQSFAPVSYQRRLAAIVQVAVAQPEPEPKPNDKPSKKPDKLSSEELFERCERLEATGMSREAAKTIVTTSQFMAEWTMAGPLGELGEEIKAVDKKVETLDKKVETLDKKIETLDKSLSMKVETLDKKVETLDKSLSMKVETLDKKVETLDKSLSMKFETLDNSVSMRLNVVIGLVLFALTFLDVPKLEDTIIGAAVKAVLKL